jgi:hypothetical protein
MSIFKETFKNEIRDQIKTRQNALVARTPASIQYYNSRNAWIRMTSSVDVENDKGALAKNYILLGGVLYNISQPLKSGIGATNKEAYSIVTPSGNEQHRLGIRPMPGITSIDIKSKSAYGSLREVTVNFQCWDIKQLEELELLYMRPGYSVLVEWGWIPYLDNNGNLQSNAKFINSVLNGGFSKEAIWKGIQNISKDTNGNYEGHYGFIKNYSWSARPDGGYDCTTSIISMGEILESLKINYGVMNTKKPTEGTFGILDKKSDFGKDKIVTKAYSENVIAGICAELHEIGIKIGKSNQPFAVPAPKSTYINNIKEYQLYRAKINVKGGGSEEESKEKLAGDGEQIYIALKDFVDILNKIIIIKDGKNPICELSLNYGAHNGGINEPITCIGDIQQLSIDPTVCLIKNEAWSDPGNLGLQDIASPDDFNNIKTILENIPNSYWKEEDWKKSQMAIIGNIYVNVNYIYSLVTNPNVEAQDKKEKNDIALYDLLKNIMLGVNRSIGNVASFEIFLDTTDNITRIIDINYTGNRKEDWEKIKEVPIEIQNTKSIVRTYKLESQIFPEQSATVAIGAQAQGGALSSDTNTLVDFNKNLIDRIVPKKDVSDIINPNNTITPEQAIEQLQNQQNNFGTIISYISSIEPPTATILGFSFGGGDGFDANDAGKYANALKDIINFKKAYISIDSKNRAIIPTKLSLTTDGIGGIIIGNLFKINDDMLPRGYKGSDASNSNVGAKIAYVVNGLNHSVQDNDWTTTIDSQFIIMDEPSGTIDVSQYEAIVALNIAANSYTPGSSTAKTNPNPNIKVNPPYGNLATAAENSIGFNTAEIPGTQGGNVGCACAVSVIFLRATGYQIIPGRDIVLGTGELYAYFISNPKLWQKKSLLSAIPGDVVLTPRAAKAGHIGVVTNTISDGSYDVISNSSSGFRGSAPGTIQKNYSIKKWNSITARNPKQTFAFQYLGPYSKQA